MKSVIVTRPVARHSEPPPPALSGRRPGGKGAKNLVAPRSFGPSALRMTMLMFFLLVPSIYAAELHYEQSLKELTGAMADYQKIKAQTVRYEVVFRRDPMRSLIDANGNVLNPAGLEGGFALQGIVRSPNTNLVLVNDQFLGEGDQLGPYKILRIRPEGVTARREKERIFIPLHENAPSS